VCAAASAPAQATRCAATATAAAAAVAAAAAAVAAAAVANQLCLGTANVRMPFLRSLTTSVAPAAALSFKSSRELRSEQKRSALQLYSRCIRSYYSTHSRPAAAAASLAAARDNIFRWKATCKCSFGISGNYSTLLRAKSNAPLYSCIHVYILFFYYTYNCRRRGLIFRLREV
jgi:hypothetical protein